MMSSMIVYSGQKEKCDRKYSGNNFGFTSRNATVFGSRQINQLKKAKREKLLQSLEELR